MADTVIEEVEIMSMQLELTPEGLVANNGQVVEGRAFMIDGTVEVSLDGTLKDNVGSRQMITQEMPLQIQSDLIGAYLVTISNGQAFQELHGEKIQILDGQMFQIGGEVVFQMLGGFMEMWTEEITSDLSIIEGNSVRIISGKAFQIIGGQQSEIPERQPFRVAEGQLFQMRSGSIEMAMLQQDQHESNQIITQGLPFDMQSQVIREDVITISSGQSFQSMNRDLMPIQGGQMFQMGEGKVYQMQGGLIETCRDEIPGDTEVIHGRSVQLIGGKAYQIVDGQKIEILEGKPFEVEPGQIFEMRNGVIELAMPGSQNQIMSCSFLQLSNGQAYQFLDGQTIEIEDGQFFSLGEDQIFKINEGMIESVSQDSINQEMIDMAIGEENIEIIDAKVFQILDGQQTELQDGQLFMLKSGKVFRMQGGKLEKVSQETSEEKVSEKISSQMTSEEIISEKMSLVMMSEEKVSEKISSEMTSEEIISQEIPLKMTSEEIISEQIPLEMTSEEISEEIPLKMTSEEIISDEIPLKMTSKEIISEEIPLKMTSEEIISEDIPLEMTSEEIISQEMSLEMTSEEIISEEIPLEMTSEEIISEDIPLEMTSEEIISQEIPLEMTSEEIISQEMSLEMTSEEKVSKKIFSEMTSEEIISDEIPLKMTSEEIISQEMPLEMTSEEKVSEKISSQMTSEEIISQERSLEMTSEEKVSEKISSEMTSEEIISDEIPLKMTSEEIISEQIPLEMTSEEIISDEIPLKMTSEEIISEEIPLRMTSKEIISEEIPLERMSEAIISEEIPQEMTSEGKLSEEISLQMTSEEITCEEVSLEMNWEQMMSKEIPVEMISKEMTSKETKQDEKKTDPEKEVKPAEKLDGGLWSVEIIGIIPDKQPVKGTAEFIEITEKPLPDDDRNENNIEISYEPLPESAKDNELQDKQKEGQERNETNKDSGQTTEEKPLSNESTPSHVYSQSCVSSPRYQGTCEHQSMVDEFRMKISRIEKEKEYIEGKYDELRRERSFQDSYRQTSSRDQSVDYSHHFSNQSDGGYTPRSTVSECYHCECMGHSSRRRNKSRKNSESEYFKLKCDQIRKEKDRLEMAYEGERRQKEDIEREYEHERNEKYYIEKRYETMLHTIERFEDTIAELRHENENLQSNLNDWSNSKVQALDELNSGMQTSEKSLTEESSTVLLEYKRSLDILDRENREFREILDALNKRNESQENLKGIELGLVREKEFLHLKREMTKLEDIVREQKRTIAHQQERIEEIRKESEDDVWNIKDANRKNERKLKELQKNLDERNRELDDVKRSGIEQVHMLEIKLQTEASKRSQFQSQVIELQLKVQRLESEKTRINQQLNDSVSSQPFMADSHSEDVSILRRKYEDEQKSKVKLANDVKYLLEDIMDLKDKNRRMGEDFIRERKEIKNMLEKQANEITQVYLTQITKLQGALSEEVRRREIIENRMNPSVRMSQPAYQHLSSPNEMPPAQQNGDFDPANQSSAATLSNEIRKREALEVENKNLLYEMNKLLSGINCEQLVGSDKAQGDESLPRALTAPSNNVLQKKNKELMKEIVELKENIEEMDIMTKKNKQHKNKISELQEELDDVTRRRDDLASAHRNLKRDVEQLSTSIDELQRKNRHYADEVDRLMKKIQELEDSFKSEKSKLVKSHENEMERALENADRKNEELQRKLQEKNKIIRQLEEVANDAGYDIQATSRIDDEGQSKQSGPSLKGLNKITSGKGNTDNYSSSLKKEVEHLQSILHSSNKRHDEEMKRVENQKKEMKEEFEKERQSLKMYFNQEKVMLEKRLQGLGTTARTGHNGPKTNNFSTTPNSYASVQQQIHPSSEAFITAQEANNSLESSVHLSPDYYTSPVDQRQSTMNSSPHGSPGTSHLNPSKQYATNGMPLAPVLNGYPNQQKYSNPESIGVYQHLPVLNGNGTSNGNSQQYGSQILNPTQDGNSFNQQQSYNVPTCKGGEVRDTYKYPSSFGADSHFVSGGDFERQIKDVEERFDQDKNHILQKAASEKRRIQNMGQQIGRQIDDMNQSCEQGLSELQSNDQYEKEEKSSFQTSLQVKDEQHEQHLKAQADVQKLQRQLQKQRRDYEEQVKKLIQDKNTINNTIQSMTKEISMLKCERKSIRCSSRSEIERLEKLHEIEKIEIKERCEKSKNEEVSRIRLENEQRLSKERKRLQQTTDDLRRKISDLEHKVREFELALQNEKHKFERERNELQRSFSRNQEDIKLSIEREYKKKFANEKLKFEKTLRELRTQIASLQEQRRQIQFKLANKDKVMGNDRISRERIILQLEQEFLEKLEKEKRPLEERINDLRDELSKAKREKNAFKTTMEKEKEELEEEVERVKDNMKDKLQRAKEEIDRRREMMNQASKMKNVPIISDLESQQQAQSNLKQYQEQLNILEQRNLTLNSKNERLERELKVLGGRVESLEARNRELQVLSTNAMSSMACEATSPRYRRSDYISFGNTSIEHSTHPRPSHMQELPLTHGGDPYSSILERVRQTMNSAAAVEAQDNLTSLRSLNEISRARMQGTIVAAVGPNLEMNSNSQAESLPGHSGVPGTQMTSTINQGYYEGIYSANSDAGRTTGALNLSGVVGNGVSQASNKEMNLEVNQGLSYDATNELEQTAQVGVSNEDLNSTMKNKISEDNTLH